MKTRLPFRLGENPAKTTRRLVGKLLHQILEVFAELGGGHFHDFRE